MYGQFSIKVRVTFAQNQTLWAQPFWVSATFRKPVAFPVMAGIEEEIDYEVFWQLKT